MPIMSDLEIHFATIRMLHEEWSALRRPKLTITGLDSSTCIPTIPRAVDEIGILYAQGTERPRYPHRMDIQGMLRVLRERAVALHVCGRAARHELLHHKLRDMTDHVQRIQVNGVLKPDEVQSLCDLYPDHEIITQHHDANLELVDIPCRNHALLVDASGGYPGTWSRPNTSKRVGFAGGLGPYMPAAYRKIARIAGDDYWVDIETRVRSDRDLLDIDRVRDVVRCLDSVFGEKDEDRN